MTNKEFDEFCMITAVNFSKYSKAIRRKVGAVIAKDGRILSLGYNGTPSGLDNRCEDIVCKYQVKECFQYNYSCELCEHSDLVTKASVIHAEENALLKLCQSTDSSINSTLYVTCAPCIRCAKQIIQSGIIRVIYGEEYHDMSGINLLVEAGINVEFLNKEKL